MVPIRDDNPISTTPIVVYGLIALNVVIFFHETSLGESALQQFINTWAIVPAELTCSLPNDAIATAINLSCPTPTDNLPAQGEWLTLVSSQFLHGGLLHLGGNMLYLWIFGNNIEDRLGPLKFLIFYVTCGALAGLSQWFFAPGSLVPTVGASGAIAGVMGAYIIRFPHAKIMTFIVLFVIPVPAYLFLGWWFVQQSLYSYASLDATANTGSGGVAYWAHAGGFIFG
ncbi:MAG: rhomboid family intramembrane serine protease, partial [Phormidesmis priestleyi]